MKTTVTIPDDLWKAAKAASLATGDRSLSSFVTDALKVALQPPNYHGAFDPDEKDNGSATSVRFVEESHGQPDPRSFSQDVIIPADAFRKVDLKDAPVILQKPIRYGLKSVKEKNGRGEALGISSGLAARDPRREEAPRGLKLRKSRRARRKRS